MQLRTTQLTPSSEGFTVNQISSFGEDANGELYIVDQGSGTTGQIFKIVPADGSNGCDPGLVGDIDGNGLVNGADLAAVLSAWGTKGGGADLDGDGSVGGSDLAILLGNWTG